MVIALCLESGFLQLQIEQTEQIKCRAAKVSGGSWLRHVAASTNHDSGARRPKAAWPAGVDQSWTSSDTMALVVVSLRTYKLSKSLSLLEDVTSNFQVEFTFEDPSRSLEGQDSRYTYDFRPRIKVSGGKDRYGTPNPPCVKMTIWESSGGLSQQKFASTSLRGDQHHAGQLHEVRVSFSSSARFDRSCLQFVGG